ALQRDWQRHGPTLTEDPELRGAAQWFGGEAITECIRVVDAGAINANGQIAGFEPGLFRGAAGNDARHQCAARALLSHAVGDIGRHDLKLGAKPWPLDRGAAALGRGHDDTHHVGWNGEADALRAARA